MTKDAPAFDFYPERWLAGVADMSDLEQIAYLRLLCHQWLRDGLPDDEAALGRLAGRKLGPIVISKFPVADDGKRRNKRLEIIRQDQRERIVKAAEKGRKMAEKRWSKGDATALLQHSSSNATAMQAPASSQQCPPPTTHQSPHTANAVSPKPPEGGADSLALKSESVASPAHVDPVRARVAGWFHRRPNTAWSAKELTAWQAVATGATPSDLDVLEAYYTAVIPSKDDYRRRDLCTLLNNWPGELDRARRFNSKSKTDDHRPF